jgi:hypothetical protein
MMQMNRQLLQSNHSWQDAEHLNYWMNIIMPYREHSPTDFLHDKNEFADEAVSNFDELKKWINNAEMVGISEKTLMAFCKNVDNLQSAFRLKVFGHIFYPHWLLALYLYMEKVISKTEFHEAFVEYSLFSGKPKPANRAAFVKTILEIEMLIAEIAHKQINREIKKKYAM